MTNYAASITRLLEHVSSALALVAIVINRTIIFQCSGTVNSDSTFLVTKKYCKLVKKFRNSGLECSCEIWEMYCYYALT